MTSLELIIFTDHLLLSKSTKIIPLRSLSFIKVRLSTHQILLESWLRDCRVRLSLFPVLKAAFSSGFIEGQSQTYRMPEDVSMDVFRLLVDWMYRQGLPRFQDLEGIECITWEFELWNKQPATLAQRDAALATLERYDALLVQLWILADQLLIRFLQNKVMVQLLAVEDREIRYATTS